MTSRKIALNPQDCLDAAEREFALGNLAAGSELIGDAAVSAVRAVLKRRGWPCDSDAELAAAVRRLDAETPGKMALAAGFAGARAGAGLARHGMMYPEDAWADMMSVRSFIAALPRLP